MENRLLKVADLAERLNISKPFAYLLLKRGVLPCVRMGRARRVRAEDIDRFILANVSKSDDKSASLPVDADFLS